MISEREKSIVRELAKRYMEAVCTEKQEKMVQRFRDTNDLKLVRPPVVIAEIPWYQMDMDGELTCLCEDKRARNTELDFRRKLFYLKHFEGVDNLYEPFFRIKRACDSTGIGIEAEENIRRTDGKNNIVSHEYKDVLEDESALELLHDPVFTLRPDKDAERMEYYTELLGDSIPIKLYGYDYMYDAPWDRISRLRGVEPILMDMYDRPEYLHAIMEKFTSAILATIDFVEKNLDVDGTAVNLHCTPSTVSGLDGEGMKGTWYRRMAQTFGVVSPAMHDEFDLEYLTRIAPRFAYTYYGCCEPLDNKIEILKKRIPNLRKMGCSPWANVEKCAEQIRGNYVLSRKPNPANVAIKTDPDIIRREIEETVKICIKYGCPYDISLKDISTVSNKPENLIIWAKTATEVLDKYYG